jgi:hypothetical protein
MTFSSHGLNQRRNLVSVRGDILKVRGEHGAAVVEEEAWRRHLGALWEASGMVLGIISEWLRNHFGTKEASRETQAFQVAPGGPGLKK